MVCNASNVVQRRLWDGLWCPYAEEAGLTMAGTGFVIVFGVATALYGWADDLTVPAAWLALVAGMAVATLPGGAALRVVGVIVTVAILVSFAIWRGLGK